jgi:hypothetical protein
LARRFSHHIAGSNDVKEYWSMYTRDVVCSKAKCGKPAAYKIAAPWSYGSFQELKSYGLACSDHLGDAFRAAEGRSKLHEPSVEETVGEIGLYRYEKGKRDKELERLGGLEANLRP